MVFVVLEGEITVILHTTQFNAKKGDSFYILSKGHAEVWIKKKGSKPNMVGEVKPGGHFGERALLSRERRAATIIASAPTCCLSISQAVFLEVCSGH